MKENKQDAFKILVIDNYSNWYKIFANTTTLDGRSIQVEQTSWRDLHVESSTEPETLIHMRAAAGGGIDPWKQNKDRIMKDPHFVLIRTFPNDIREVNFRNQVLGLMFGNLNSVNTLESVLNCMDR